MTTTKKVRVAINAYGVIGKRVADAVPVQIRALTGIEREAVTSIAKTDAALGIVKSFLPATAAEVARYAAVEEQLLVAAYTVGGAR